MDGQRTICFDSTLQIEAYQFQGVMQNFPNHFHEYYVIGFIESGKRRLTCQNKIYLLETGDITLFGPQVNHACAQVDARTLDYRCLNVPCDTMRELTRQILGCACLPQFSQIVIHSGEHVPLMREVHEKIMAKETGFDKAELFLLLIEQLLRRYTLQGGAPPAEDKDGVARVCAFIEMQYAAPLTLARLSEEAGMNQYGLVRAFTRLRGITPYQYLQTIRVNRAKKMLEQGAPLLETALACGFTDQSHFTNIFKRFIGVTPGQYRDIF